MSDRVEFDGLSVDRGLYQLVEEIAAGTGVDVAGFWRSLDGILDELGAQNRELLDKRDRMQDEIDTWHRSHSGEIDYAQYKSISPSSAILGVIYELTALDRVGDQICTRMSNQQNT